MSQPKPVSNEVLIQQLKWRYACKKFDKGRRIPDEDWRTLEDALVLTPSSFGLQPWKFFIVTNPELKEKLVAASWHQKQVAEASHVVVLAIKKKLGAPEVEKYVQRIAEVRGVPLESLEKFKHVMLRFVEHPHFDVDGWAKDQVYIALGNFMTSAAMLGIDACPMEGIEPAKYDELLGLEKLGYGTCVVCPAGYRAPEDKYAHTAKVRFTHEEMIAHI